LVEFAPLRLISQQVAFSEITTHFLPGQIAIPPELDGWSQNRSIGAGGVKLGGSTDGGKTSTG